MALMTKNTDYAKKKLKFLAPVKLTVCFRARVDSSLIINSLGVCVLLT